MHLIAQQEKELNDFKSVAQALQQQIVDACRKTVVDSDALRALRRQRAVVQQSISDLSNKILSDIIA